MSDNKFHAEAWADLKKAIDASLATSDPPHLLSYARAAEWDACEAAAMAVRAFFRARAVRLALEDAEREALAAHGTDPAMVIN